MAKVHLAMVSDSLTKRRNTYQKDCQQFIWEICTTSTSSWVRLLKRTTWIVIMEYQRLVLEEKTDPKTCADFYKSRSKMRWEISPQKKYLDGEWYSWFSQHWWAPTILNSILDAEVSKTETTIMMKDHSQSPLRIIITRTHYTRCRWALMSTEFQECSGTYHEALDRPGQELTHILWRKYPHDVLLTIFQMLDHSSTFLC